MRLGIMQPYFFPYLGYFELILRTDRWVVFDTAQYIRHGWVNRNRILHPKAGWQYVIAPVRKHPRYEPISGIEVNEETDWRRKLVAQLAHYQGHAPFFLETMTVVEECLELAERRLARLNGAILDHVCRHLGIRFDATYFSDMQLNVGEIRGPGDWALGITRALGASEYVNPPGGAGLFDSDQFAAAAIKLSIQEFAPIMYSCGRYTFEPNLSIIDVMMWVSREDIMKHLRAQTLPGRPGQ
jgi:hypothetical protein